MITTVVMTLLYLWHCRTFLLALATPVGEFRRSKYERQVRDGGAETNMQLNETLFKYFTKKSPPTGGTWRNATSLTILKRSTF